MNTSFFRFIVLMCLLTGATPELNHAQTSFQFDSDTTIIEDAAENLWDKLLEKKTTDDFEFRFRFITNPALTRYSFAFILTFKDSTWSAQYFEYVGKEKQGTVELVVRQDSLSWLWGRLQAQKVLRLPSQKEITYKMKKFSADTLDVFDEAVKQMMVTDGTSYHFSLQTKDKHRRFSYHCPQRYLSYYDQVEELYRAFAMICFIRRYLGLSLNFC